MDGQLAAAATLVAHARAWRSGAIPKPQYAKLSAFRYASRLQVDMPKGIVVPGRERYKPADISRWLDWIPRFKASAIRLSVVGGVVRDERLPERAVMAAFSPFGFTTVNPRGKGGAWLAERVPVEPGKDSRGGLWVMRFRHIEDGELTPPVSVPQASARLAEVVADARSLARSEAPLAQWMPYLEQAAATLASKGRPPRVYDVLPPKGYTAEAQRLANAVAEAWILGGLMTWTDHKPKSDWAVRAHRDVTTELYACLVEGMIAAVNEGLSR